MQDGAAGAGPTGPGRVPSPPPGRGDPAAADLDRLHEQRAGALSVRDHGAAGPRRRVRVRGPHFGLQACGAGRPVGAQGALELWVRAGFRPGSHGLSHRGRLHLPNMYALQLTGDVPPKKHISLLSFMLENRRRELPIRKKPLFPEEGHFLSSRVALPLHRLPIETFGADPWLKHMNGTRNDSHECRYRRLHEQRLVSGVTRQWLAVRPVKTATPCRSLEVIDLQEARWSFLAGYWWCFRA